VDASDDAVQVSGQCDQQSERADDSAETLDDLARRFADADTNGDGKLSMKEIKACLKQWRPGLAGSQVLAIMSTVDKDGDGTVSYEEFCVHSAGVLGLESAAPVPSTVRRVALSAEPGLEGSVTTPKPRTDPKAERGGASLQVQHTVSTPPPAPSVTQAAGQQTP
jgi:hypothetical protein